MIISVPQNVLSDLFQSSKQDADVNEDDAGGGGGSYTFLGLFLFTSSLFVHWTWAHRYVWSSGQIGTIVFDYATHTSIPFCPVTFTIKW